MKIGQEPDILITDPLGSCLCLTAFDAVSQIGGVLNAMLPLSKINTQKAAINPFMFVDTGIPALFEALYAQGIEKDNLVVKAIGCSNPMGSKEVFKIGKRNYSVLQEVLTKDDICLAAKDVGGTVSRAVQLDLASGRTIILSDGTKRVL
ncbi:MAG: chemotaxis protein CheD [Desulfobacterales bacterium]|jgi:chemotaxis protein CheD